MISVYIDGGFVPITSEIDAYVDNEYGGIDTFYFSLPANDFETNRITEDAQIKVDDENIFIVEKRNTTSKLTSFSCVLDMREWETREPYFLTSELEQFKTKTVFQVLDSIKPPNWKILNKDASVIKRTIELSGATDYDVLIKCMDIYSVVFEISVINKTLSIVDPSNVKDSGIYVTKELNLKSHYLKGDGSKLITRLYCYGKDGLTFESINNGKKYVENHEYTNKVICGFWKDERYDVKESLLNDARERMKTLSFPVISHTIDIIDLAMINDEYDFLKLKMYCLVNVVIDESTKIIERVVKYRKYINAPHKNVITLSNNVVTINKKIEDIIGLPFDSDSTVIEEARRNAEKIINDFSKKGYRYETENEIYFLDKLPKENAKYVMRMNLGGIAFSQNGWQGPYTTAWTIDGSFNAQFITSGTLKAIDIVGTNIYGSTISGGILKGTSIESATINISQDARIGNILYLGSTDGSAYRYISLNGGVVYPSSDVAGDVLAYRPGYVSLHGNSGCGIGAGSGIGGAGVSAEQLSTTNRLSLSGQTITSSVPISVASDNRLKKNVKDIDLSSLIDEISVKEYSYIDSDKIYAGVIAQDMMNNPMRHYALDYIDFPTKKMKNGKNKTKKRFSVNYQNLFLGACQKINKLEERINDLEFNVENDKKANLKRARNKRRKKSI